MNFEMKKGYKMQKKQKNIGVNAALNVIKQGLSVLFPLITYPYALRVLGIINTGKVNYGSSIISYFSLIAMLGVAPYAVREGAKRKNDPVEFEIFVKEVFTINVLSTVISYILLFAAIFAIPNLHEYSVLLLVQSLSIALTTLGVDWINTIHEDFLLITIRSIVTHVVSLVLLFAFVHEPQDLYIYALLTVITNGIVCVSNWGYCRRYVRVKLTKNPNIREHIRPLLILFANTVAITIYVSIDTTMLGWIKGDYNVGIYSAAVKVYNIVKNMLAAVYAVAVPRLAFYRGNQDSVRYKNLCTDLWGSISLLLIPAGVGLISISEEIILFMGGEEYLDAVPCLIILSVALIFAIYGGLATVCMNITLGREKENLNATIISAALNFALNLIFIPAMAQNGAAITTLISEAFVFLFCFLRIPSKGDYMDFKKVIMTIIHSLMGAVIVALISFVAKNVITNYLFRIVVIVILSMILYSVFLLVIKDSYFCGFIAKIQRKIKLKPSYVDDQNKGE